MIKIDDDQRTIHLTRGDVTNGKYNKLVFYCSYINTETEEEEEYLFSLDDKISFVVFEKKGYTKNEILRKEYTLKELGYTEPTKRPEIPLTDIDTKKFPLKNKPATYWYDIVLNDNTTVIGYDEDGASKLIVYPEAEEE